MGHFVIRIKLTQVMMVLVLIYHLAEELVWLWLGLMLTHRIALQRIDAQKEDDNPADQPLIQPIVSSNSIIASSRIESEIHSISQSRVRAASEEISPVQGTRLRFLRAEPQWRRFWLRHRCRCAFLARPGLPRPHCLGAYHPFRDSLLYDVLTTSDLVCEDHS